MARILAPSLSLDQTGRSEHLRCIVLDDPHDILPVPVLYVWD
jgi:hypothetical protein